MKTSVLRLFLGLVFALAAPHALAQEKGKLRSIPPGITTIDLTGDGKPETILKAWRENFNAHGYYVIQFLQSDIAQAESLSGDEGIKSGEYKIIGIDRGHDGSGSFAHELTTAAAADCTMQDYRLLIVGKQTFLIEGKLALNESYCNTGPVAFRFYEMTMNKEMVPGTTKNYFESIREWITEDKYTDVENAFDANAGKLISKLR